MCRGRSTKRSMKTEPSPNEASASDEADSKNGTRSSMLRTTRIPLPPPPIAALMMTGRLLQNARRERAGGVVSANALDVCAWLVLGGKAHPDSSTNLTAASADVTGPSVPGTTGTPAARGARGGLVGERVEVLDLRADEGDAVVGAAGNGERERGGGERGEKVRERDPWRAVLRKVAVAAMCGGGVRLGKLGRLGEEAVTRVDRVDVVLLQQHKAKRKKKRSERERREVVMAGAFLFGRFPHVPSQC